MCTFEWKSASTSGQRRSLARAASTVHTYCLSVSYNHNTPSDKSQENIVTLLVLCGVPLLRSVLPCSILFCLKMFLWVLLYNAVFQCVQCVLLCSSVFCCVPMCYVVFSVLCCVPVSSAVFQCVLLCSNVLCCVPMCYVVFSVLCCVPMSSVVFQCVLLCSSVLCCVPVCYVVFQCVMLCSNVLCCVPMSSVVFQCVLLCSSVFCCVPVCSASCVLPCVFSSQPVDLPMNSTNTTIYYMPIFFFPFIFMSMFMKMQPPQSKLKVSSYTVSNPHDCSKLFRLHFSDKPVQSNTISTSLGSTQPN